MKTLISTVLLSLAASVSFAQNVDDGSNGSNWIYIERVDPFTDKNTSVLGLVPGDDARGHSPSSVMLRCDNENSRGFEVLVKSAGFVSSDSITVTYRFGKQDPLTETWDPSTTGSAAFLPAGYKDFIENLKTGEDFVFGFYDYNGTLGHSKFDNDTRHPKLNFFLNGCK